jgi:putative ABC transport system substrate-binding protein
MRICLRRRDFIAALGGAAAWPLAARAQRPALPVIGVLSTGSIGFLELAAFREGLKETGYVEGQNVASEYRSAEIERGRLPELAADLIRRRVAVIFVQSSSATLAAKRLTTTIPIVFTSDVDPVALGLVASLNRPGGNVTGFTGMNRELTGKQLGFLRELLPGATRFAVLIDRNGPNAPLFTRDAQAAATAIGRQIEVLAAGNSSDIDTAFATLLQKRAEALLVNPNTLFAARRAQIVTLAARHAVPTIYPSRAYAEAGGLMSYGSSSRDLHRQAGTYVGRILKGEKPADLPVQQATKFEFVINLQTARALGITIPPTLLAIADEVIE